MASALPDVIEQIAQDVAALTPPTRPTVTYFSLESGKLPHAGASSDRGFYFDFASSETVSLRGDVSEVRYQWALMLKLSGAGHTPASLREAARSEARAIIDVVNARSVWPAGTISVFASSHTVELDQESDEVELRIELSALVEETP